MPIKGNITSYNEIFGKNKSYFNGIAARVEGTYIEVNYTTASEGIVDQMLKQPHSSNVKKGRNVDL